MAKYLLDTDIIEYLGDTESPFHLKCAARLEALDEEDELFASVLALYELEYGIAGSQDDLRSRLQLLKKKILAFYTVLPLTELGSELFGRIKNAFKQNTGAKHRAMKTYTVDMIVASAAIEHGAILVSNDRLFAQLADLEPDLKVENWAAEQA